MPRTDTRVRQFDSTTGKDRDDIAFNHGIVRVRESAVYTAPIPAGATLTLSNLVPTNVFLVGVVAHVIDPIFGATGSLTDFDIGDGTTVNLYGDAIGITKGTRTSSADFLNANAGWRYTTAAEDVVLTANGENFAGGAVAVSVLYQEAIGGARRALP